MPKQKENPVVRRLAVQKYRRMRTLVGKMVELADLRSLKINMLIYNPKFNSMEQIWTDKSV